MLLRSNRPQHFFGVSNMQSVARFRVVSPFLAVQPSAHKERFVTVPSGAIIETSADLQEPGVITITLNGNMLLAFHRDISERAEPVDDLSRRSQEA
jgi:hypothetical protein